MPGAFSPSFVKFQEDTERYLVARGKRDKTKEGFIVFHGYDAALKLMFNRFLEAGALEPLVSHFRTWNWEHAYNGYLLRLTDVLLEQPDWPLLKRLWSGVIAKRRKLYNDIRKLERKAPGTVSSSSVKGSREKLVETLVRVRAFSARIGSAEDTQSYESIIGRVKAGKLV
jgi:hypothetical protein